MAGPGSVIEIKNSGKVRHELSTPDTPKLMQLETLAPGGVRRQRFDAPRRLRHPRQRVPAHHDLGDHRRLAVLRGGRREGRFSINNVPDGTATLKVWTRGKWVAEQEIDGGGKDELTIKVASTHEKENKPATE